MSPLEITNRINDATRSPSYWKLFKIQAALEDWASKYPDDPWIYPREYQLYFLFARLHSGIGDSEAVHCRALLQAQYARIRSNKTTP